MLVMTRLIIFLVSGISLLASDAESKISEPVARGFYQECLQVTKQEAENNKKVTNQMVQSFCVFNVNELDKLVDDKGYEKLMLKHHNPDHKSKEFDIMLNACKIHLN